MVSKIPVQIEDFEKIPQISEEIKNMMKSNANVFLEKEQPYCYLSRVERSFAELSLGCNLKQMVCVLQIYQDKPYDCKLNHWSKSGFFTLTKLYERNIWIYDGLMDAASKIIFHMLKSINNAHIWNNEYARIFPYNFDKKKWSQWKTHHQYSVKLLMAKDLFSQNLVKEQKQCFL